MTAPAEIRFARTDDGIDIAWTAVGEGADYLFIPGFVSHLDMMWDALPWFTSFVQVVARRYRVIVLDKRGTGLSDRSLGFGSIEDRTRDIGAVLDDAGCEDVIVHAISEGGPMALVFAATHPERVSRLVIYGSLARALWAPDYPEGRSREEADQFVEWIADDWGRGHIYGSVFMQHAPDEGLALDSLARFERNACTRQLAADIMRRNVEIDVRAVLPAVTAPTLVMHNTGDPVCPVEWGRYMARHIPGAEYFEQDGDFHGSWRPQDFAPFNERFMEFHDLHEGRGAARPADVARGDGAGGGGGAGAGEDGRGDADGAGAERRVATVLFTDIVGSTEKAAELGDGAWRELLDRHDTLSAGAVERLGGWLVKTTGDGILATFDGPSRGVECARAIQEAVGPLGLAVRAGVHTGEIERRGNDVGGIGVHIGARVASLAGPGEVWATRTVKDLTAGSGLVFSERGRQVLKGIPDEWDVFAVEGS